jgi:hypothetical protein
MNDSQILVVGPYPVNSPAFHAFVGAQIPHLPTSEHLQTVQQPDYLARELFRRYTVFTEIIAGLQPSSTIALRVLNLPHRSTRQPRLELWLLAKSIQPTADLARQEVLNLWSIVQHAFPSEFPFGYALIPVSSADLELQQRSLAPVRLQQLLTIAKSLDGRGASADAFPHPYRTTPSLYALVPLFSALASSPARLALTVSLRRGVLSGREQIVRQLEEYGLAEAASAERLMQQIEAAHDADGQPSMRARLAERRIARAGAMREDERLRARMGAQVLDNLLRSQHRLLDMRVSLASWSEDDPPSVVQAVRAALSGSLLTAESDAPLYANPPEYERHTPAIGEPAWSTMVNDHVLLEHRPAPTPAQQWRTLVTPEEAAGLFCLPMPPEHGQIPGVLAQTQPFFLPVEDEQDPAGQHTALRLGPILARGVPTNHWLHIPISKLDQHMLIAGRSGSGKTNTCLVLLRELARAGKPFLVLDPLDKSDYRLLLGDGLLDDATARLPRASNSRPLNETLHIYTLGAAASPFTFNPFRVPPGVTVQKHISQLLRCFLTAFVVSDPIPAIYRAALRQLYASCSWHMDRDDRGGHGERTPTFSQFLQVLEQVVVKRSGEYSTEVRGNIRQATLLRMGSLLEDNARTLNVHPDDDRDPLANLVRHPTVLELGHIGSDEDKSLIMAFLLTCLVPHIQNRHDRPLHVTLIEEAHRLMRRGGGGSELRGDAAGQTRGDFSNLLAEVRGYNQGIIVADQSPSELVASVFANTATHIMHQLRDPQSFEMMTATFVLNPPQANFARHLSVGHAITETAQGTPVHIRPDNLSDALKDALAAAAYDGTPYFHRAGERRVVSDEAVARIMYNRRSPTPQSVDVPDYEALLLSRQRDIAQRLGEINGMLPTGAPSPFCVGCLPLWRTGACQYANKVRHYRQTEQSVVLRQQVMRAVERQQDVAERWKIINQAGPQIADGIGAAPADAPHVVFCDLVHTAESISRHKEPERRKQIAVYKATLRDFHRRYRPRPAPTTADDTSADDAEVS